MKTKKTYKTKTYKTKAYKTKTYKTKAYKTKKLNKFNTLRIITDEDNVNNDDNRNDLKVYIDIFKKYNFNVDIIYLPFDKNFKVYYDKNTHYNVNLFINKISPVNFKTIFPANIHLFSGNPNTFTNYNEIKNIDIVLCNTRYCYDFMNFIKKENKYNYDIKYTNFTTIIPNYLQNKGTIKDIDKDTLKDIKAPLKFIHLPFENNDKNTDLIIKCWIENDGFLNINKNVELHVICSGLCFTNYLNKNRNTYKKNENKIEIIKLFNKNIIKFNNLYLYLEYNNEIYKHLLNTGSFVFCINKKQNYPHNINIARYFKNFIISINASPMKEMIIENGNNKNGILLKNLNNFKKKIYKNTKFIFKQPIPDTNELKNIIIKCINQSYKNSNNTQLQYNQDKKYFNDVIGNIIKNINKNIKQNKNVNFNNIYENIRKPFDINTVNIDISRYEKYGYGYPKNESEDKCKYISSRGFLKSCDIHSIALISSYAELIGYDMEKFNSICNMNNKNNKDNKVIKIYICNTALKRFINIINKIKCRFVLVSGDSDNTINENYFNDNLNYNTDNENDTKKLKEFINNKNLVHWYPQNCIISHPKITHLPIGLDYHTLNNTFIKEEAKNIISPLMQEKILNEIISNTKDFWKREIKCYVNFLFNMEYSIYGYDRIEASKELTEASIEFDNNSNTKDYIYIETSRIPKTETLKKQSKYAFVIAPYGNGLDTHRAWEALILGCIPIIRTSGINSLYADLPVLIINKWSDINSNLLHNTIDEFKTKHLKKQFNYEKLKLEYWVNKFNSHK